MSQNTFHVGIYVKDLPAAVEQYKKILGLEPAKVKEDYAKFELADPPVILALNLGGEPGTVHHLGIRYPETGQVAHELKRTKREGVAVLEQQGTTCCYAKSDKFWVRDADGMPWEMYTLLADADVLSDTDPAVGELFRKGPSVDTQVDAESCCAPTCCGGLGEERDETVTELSAVPQPLSRGSGHCGPTVSIQADAQPLQEGKSSCC